MFAWLTTLIKGQERNTFTPRRSSSYFANGQRDEAESQRLLAHDADDEIDHDGCFPPHSLHDRCPMNPHTDLPVYTTIHRIRRDITAAIDDPYSLEQLRDPRMNFAVVRPLVDKLYDPDDVSTVWEEWNDYGYLYREGPLVYCLLVNRVQFQREQATKAHQQSVCATRALLCELLANRILRRFHEDNPGAKGLLLLAQILVGAFDPFGNAPPDVVDQFEHLAWAVYSRTGNKRKIPALEIAIISESKVFLSSSACQKVVNAIYTGRVIYTPTSFIDILPDHYKHKPVSLYNPRGAPLLNQYRLIVPRTRNFIEVGQFILLLVLFVIVMADRDASHFHLTEFLFIIYAIGFLLDMFATMLEHGWRVYTQNLWSFLDVTFASVFSVYLTLRLHGWRVDDVNYGQQALDVLAMGAPVLVPRLAFNLMSENILFLSLRSMMRDFTVLTALAVWCFGGFLLSMLWLSNGGHRFITISKWMLWVWFGLDGTGIQRSVDFHWLLGPVLMVTFAFLGNTLFLTILVSMLTTTFSTIVSNATAEIQFRRAVLTLEGVKSDAIFAYQPPFNILALLILLPLKFLVTPRWFHKINVTAVRTLNAPLLLTISLLERRHLWSGAKRPIDTKEQLARISSRSRPWDFSRSFSVHGDIQAVFDAEPPQEIEDEVIEEEDVAVQGDRRMSMEEEFEREFGTGRDTGKNVAAKNRRDSVYPFAGLSQNVKHLVNEGSQDSDGDVKTRLEALEQSTMRIEAMLAKLCQSMVDGETGSGGMEEKVLGETGTMRDLDRSGTSDIEE